MGFYNTNHKFLFSHASKSGGSSLISAFQSCFPEGSNVCPAHCGFDYICNELRTTGENPKKYMKIATVRNPWDRAVSLYYHLLSKEKRLMTVFDNNANEDRKVKFMGNFDDFIRIMTNLPDNYYDNFSHIILFEDLQTGFDTICKQLGTSSKKLPMIDYNTGRPRDYRSMYNQKSIDYIYNKNKKIIDKFSYTFE